MNLRDWLALLVGVALVAIVSAGCTGSSKRPTPSSTAGEAGSPTVASTAQPGACPVDAEICSFALEVEAALQQGDTTELISPDSSYATGRPDLGIGAATLHLFAGRQPPRLVSIGCPEVRARLDCSQFFALGFFALPRIPGPTPAASPPDGLAILGFHRAASPGAMPIIVGLNKAYGAEAVLKGGAVVGCHYGDPGSGCEPEGVMRFVLYGNNGSPLPDRSLGVEAHAIVLGSDIDFPADTSLIAAAAGYHHGHGGYWDLARYDRIGNGPVTKRQLWSSATPEPGQNITGVAVSENATTLILSLCLGDQCHLEGENKDVVTEFHRSFDGGLTWTKIGQLQGEWGVIKSVGDAALAAGIDRQFDSLLLVPPFTPLPRPAGAQPDSRPIPYGAIVGWRASGGRLIDAAGQTIAQVPLSNPRYEVGIVEVLRGLDQRLYAARVEVGTHVAEGAAVFNRYAALISPASGAPTLIRLDGLQIEFGAWLDPRNAIVTADAQLATACPASTTTARRGAGPAILDFDRATLNFLSEPALCNGGAVVVLGATRGPFVRVKAPGECLNVRREPVRAAPVVECAADGVLLTPAGGSTAAAGVEWLPVKTPSGKEGWVSAEFLDR